ncbi:hypothetical protein WJX73_000831 [Symbiochloris irregularis]|uniref:5'-3' exonuclease domain-containing protein n=1 Tax=Symbiochloris irregularis TaxID=706552 RepID=A0AAW1NRR9_9CHLO
MAIPAAILFCLRAISVGGAEIVKHAWLRYLHTSSLSNKVLVGAVPDCASICRHSLLSWHQARRNHSIVVDAQTQQAASAVYDNPQEFKDRLILVDAMSMVFRTHYAVKEDSRLRNQMGEDTTIVHSLVTQIISLLHLQPRPTHVAVVFDSIGGRRDGAKGHGNAAHVMNFRHELFPGYKAQRREVPQQIIDARPRLYEVLEAMGITAMDVTGVEADDVIGTLASRALQQDMAVVIVSPDKDFCQLLQPGLQILRPPKKDERAFVPGRFVSYNEGAFLQETGLQPHQWVDMMALAGDTADNIPGVNKIGVKTAPKLIAAAGSLDALLANPEVAETVPRGKSLSKILASPEGRNAANLARILVTIQTDCDYPPVRAPLSELKLIAPPDAQKKKALALFQELDLTTSARSLQRFWNALELEN